MPVELTVAPNFTRCPMSSPVNGPVIPLTITVWPCSVIPPSALILPAIEITPLGDIGISPRINCCATALLIAPFAPTIRSKNACVGVLTVNDPTLTRPLAPTMKPLEFEKKTLPPILPSLKEFNSPLITTAPFETMLTRLPAWSGTKRSTR